ncbi:hypothetical protein J7I94_33470 [Streptomyces sp. ISL-12]|uniref:hypothetical protein n=1 Tax=Streptomyces sp. ISL-12 TaxID=2819177 RepID=UPI001BEB8396|nr:hypothetical protein [Streptomyces sp. ISL-12]MBT2415389.1 hypothetical protein [Streptomyces sp. ISL-12]
MPADEVTHGADAEASRVRTGPRHAAPRKPLFTRFHVPAGKAIALAAMPTAVLMGMGFTPTLAAADGNDQTSTSKSLTADEYKACVEALTGDGDDKDDKGDASASATASPSASASGAGEADDGTEPSPSETDTGAGAGTGAGADSGSGEKAGSSSSSDSGSDDKDKEEAEPEPSATTTGSSASPSATASGGGVLEGIGDALEDLFTGGKSTEESASATTTPSATPSASASASAGPSGSGGDEGAPSDAADEASEAVRDAEETVDEATASPTTGGTDTGTGTSTSPTPSASASASASTDPAVDCPIATDAEGGVDNTLPLPNRPWELEASSLTLKGASYKGIVEVRTADGTTKKVLKYVISNGTDIGDLHQIVHDETTGRTHHVQAAEGSTSTIRDGDTVMYTESISGNLLGLIPITFDPEHPPPLDIPLIYFTNVKVVQAGQFGGTLTVPGLHQYMTD